MQSGKGMKKDFEKHPKYKDAYIKAFDRMLKKREEDGLKIDRRYWPDGEHVMRWWCGDDPAQITIDDYMSMINEVSR